MHEANDISYEHPSFGRKCDFYRTFCGKSFKRVKLMYSEFKYKLQSATKLAEMLCFRGPFCHFANFKRGKMKLSCPTLSMDVVLLFKLSIGKTKHSNFDWKGGVTPFDESVSTILLPM